MKEILRMLTRSENQTKKLAEAFAKEVMKLKLRLAIVIGLEGELGSGKTTFAKGFAKGLGIREEMKSPTFILMRVFKIKKRNFFHIDAYRDQLDFREFLKSPKNILLIEWPGKVRKFLPKEYLRFKFLHIGKNFREIIFYAPHPS